MSFYEKYILPRILNCACASEPITYQRKKVVPLAEGKILEVGIGSGLNLPFYDKSKIEEIWGIDPSEELNAMAKKVVKIRQTIYIGRYRVSRECKYRRSCSLSVPKWFPRALCNSVKQFFYSKFF